MVMVYKFWFLAADATNAIFVVFEKQKPILFTPIYNALVVAPKVQKLLPLARHNTSSLRHKMTGAISVGKPNLRKPS
jgi:hypothetical protein